MPLAGCGGSGGISDKAHNDYVAGCTSSGQTKAACECLFSELKKRGVDSESKFKGLADRIKTAIRSSNPRAAMPQEFKAAALACRSKIK